MVLLGLLLSNVGCSQLLFHRSYLTEMEQDDSTYFNPTHDFPVVAGDTGRYWETPQERLSRTPASENEVLEDRGRKLLKQELRRLEGQQHEDDLVFYESYKHHLSTTSERIYFLKLDPFERKEYLFSRGIESHERQNASLSSDFYDPNSSDIVPGMTKDDVMSSWGKPARVEIAGNPSYENERWLYKTNGATKYIYFESGRVDGWE